MKLGCSYFGNRILRHARQDMQELIDCGCNFVVHTFNENDMVFCHKAVCEIVQMSKEMGLETYIDPWGVGKVFGGESFSNFVMNNMDAVQHASDGGPAGMACPNHPKFRAFMREWSDAAAETGADYYFWDEPHFYLPHWMGGRPGTWGCCCTVCKQKFEERFGIPMPAEVTVEVEQFKEDSIMEFLGELTAYGHGKGLKNCLCVLPHAEAEKSTNDWMRISSIPNLHVFGTDPYWLISKKDLSYVEVSSRLVKEVCDARGLEPQVWLQGFRIPGGKEPELVEALDIMINAGIRNIAVWGFLACEHLSWIRPDNAPLAWDTIKQAYRRLAEKYA